MRQRCGVVGALAQKDVGDGDVELADLRWASLGTLTSVLSSQQRSLHGCTSHARQTFGLHGLTLILVPEMLDTLTICLILFEEHPIRNRLLSSIGRAPD